MATLKISTQLGDAPMVILAILLGKFVLFFLTVGTVFVTNLRHPNDTEQNEPVMWKRRAGLYAIFVTQSNDFAFGIPLFEATPIWGQMYTPIVFIVGVAQLAVLNPLAFTLMEAANQEAAAGSSGGRVRIGTTQGASSSADAASSGQQPAEDDSFQQQQRPRQKFAVLRKVIRSPVVVSALVGLALCGILYATDAELPEWIEGTMRELSRTFTGTALVTLGLSLRTRPAVLRGRRVAALCLLTAKFLLAPLLMRLFADALVRGTDPNEYDEEEGASRAFAFVYGALPSAPTVVVFAREYGEKTSFLATLQMLVLIATVPLILGLVVVIENPLLTREPTALILLVDSVAVVGAVVSGYFVVALSSSLLVRCRDTATTAINGGAAKNLYPLCWLLGVGLTALLLCTSEAVDRGFEDCARNARLRPLASWSLHCLRVQLAFVSMLMAHQACPVRSKRAQTVDGARTLRNWQIFGAVMAAVIPGICEMVDVGSGEAQPMSPPPPPSNLSSLHDITPNDNPGEDVCGGEASRTLRYLHITLDITTAVVILLALSIMWLAPADTITCEAPSRRAPDQQQSNGSLLPLSLAERSDSAANNDAEASGSQQPAANGNQSTYEPPTRRQIGRGMLPQADSLDSLPSFSAPPSRSPSIGASLNALGEDRPQRSPRSSPKTGRRASPSNDNRTQIPSSISLHELDRSWHEPVVVPLAAADNASLITIATSPPPSPPPASSQDGLSNAQQPTPSVRCVPSTPDACSNNSSPQQGGGGGGAGGVMANGENGSPPREPPSSSRGGLPASPTPRRRLSAILQSPLLGDAERVTRERTPLLVRWRTRLCLLMAYAVLSMLLSVTTVSTSLQNHAHDENIQIFVRLLDQIALFLHALVLAGLFGFTDEVAGPLWSKLGTCLAALLASDADGEVAAFPRRVQGFWG